MNPRPVIGIVAPVTPVTVELPARSEARLRIAIFDNYIQCIHAAGGTPIILSPTIPPESYAPLLDGWLIIGGGDLDPALYGQPPHPKSELEHPVRTEFEQRLATLLSPNLPVFGICYGCQFLNVLEGGTLHQHLPEIVGHDTHSSGAEEPISVENDSRLAAIAGPGPYIVRSYHHQAIATVAPSLRVTAHAADGTIEAVESTDDRFRLAVQWHPERTPESPDSIALFRAFIQAASAFQLAKSHETTPQR